MTHSLFSSTARLRTTQTAGIAIALTWRFVGLFVRQVRQ